MMGNRDGAVVRACCWFSSLLRGFYPGFSVFVPPKKTLQIPIRRTTSWMCLSYYILCISTDFYQSSPKMERILKTTGPDKNKLSYNKKKFCGEMVLSGPPWPSILLKNCRLPSKQLRDTASHHE